MKQFRKYGILFTVILAALMVCGSAWAATDIADFARLQTAFSTGGDYKLTGNITVTAVTLTSKDVTIDLNGHAINNSVSDALVIQEGGKLTINDSVGTGLIKGASPLTVKGDRTAGSTTKINSTITLNAGTVTTDDYYGVFIVGNGAIFNMNGGTINGTTGTCVPVMGNGSARNWGTEINITGGTLNGGEGLAIYHPQEGMLNISGGTMTGSEGVQLKAGGLSITNITGGTIHATGAHVTTLVDDSNGTVDTGAAISLIGNSGYAGNMSLNISGAGILVKSDHGYAIRQEITVGSDDQVDEISISAGTFEGAEGALLIDDYDAISGDVAITGGKYSSDPKDYVSEGYSVAKVDGLFAVIVKPKEMKKPELPEGVSADVQPAAAEIKIVSDPKHATEDEIKNTKEAAIDGAKAGSITSADLDIDEEDGFVVAKDEVITAAAGDALKKEESQETVKEVVALPVFSATVSEDKVAAVQFPISGDELYADKAGDVKVLKILSATKGEFFKFESDPAGTDDGEFALQLNGKSDYLSADAAIDASKGYNLLLFIKDNGSFDLNEAKGEILDPAAILKTEAQAEPAHHSSSGCSAGFAALALLALVPMVITRRKK